MPIITGRTADLSLLHPVVRAKVQAIQAQLDAEGILLRVFESFRSPQRQRTLYAQGRTAPGRIVTKAPPWKSYHQYGCAVDFVFHEGGEWHWGRNSTHRQQYARMHAIAREHGLEPLSWETPHVQLIGTTIAQLYAGQYPAGGDAAWADNFNEHIDAWSGSPSAPPRARSSADERPALAEVGLGGPAPADDLPAPSAINLRSRLLSGNAALEAVLDGHLLLRPSGQRVPGIELVQDALNHLATLGVPEYAIETGQYRGYFGQRTERAVKSFQEDFRLRIDGEVGQETIKSLDATILHLEQGQPAVIPRAEFIAAPATAAAPGAPGYHPPELSISALAGLDFSTADTGTGRHLREAYAQADITKYEGDPSNCQALLQFPSKAVYFEAKMAICADGSPRAVAIDPPYGLIRTAFKNPGTGGGYFNAEEVPYIVLPGKSEDGRFDFVKTFGIGKLDCGVVIYRGRVSPAFYGEVGPVFRLGEASIQVHENLPAPRPWTSDAKVKVRNSSVGGEVIFIVFPGTAVSGTGKTAAAWMEETLAKSLAHFQTFVASGGANH